MDTTGKNLPKISARYRLIEPIGKGVAGTVYLGERTDFPKRVAVKVLHSVTPQALAATSGEQGLLALLEHPNIVRLLEHGVAEDGRRFLVMEYVEGLQLDAFADARKLTVAARVALLVKVMEAVSHAHRHLVVHADLKPSNVLVNESGEPMLLDFGIGALVEENGAAKSAAWTKGFASPEQETEGVVTIASDVYALGIVATLLLAGAMPDAEKDGLRPATGSLKRLPDAEVERIAQARSTSPRGLRRALSGDLDAIMAKALRSLPSERYLSVEMITDDLRAHVAGRPVVAQPWNRGYLFERWVRRHRAGAIVAALMVVVTSASVAGVTVQTVRAARQRRVAVARLHEIVALTGTLEGELYESVHALAQGEAASKSLLQAATSSLDKLATEDRSDGALSVEIAQQYAKLAELQRAQSGGAPAAESDVKKGLEILQGVRASDRNSAAAQAEIVELQKLRAH